MSLILFISFAWDGLIDVRMMTSFIQIYEFLGTAHQPLFHLFFEQHWEATILIVAYVAYILLMTKNQVMYLL